MVLRSALTGPGEPWLTNPASTIRRSLADRLALGLTWSRSTTMPRAWEVREGGDVISGVTQHGLDLGELPA